MIKWLGSIGLLLVSLISYGKEVVTIQFLDGKIKEYVLLSADTYYVEGNMLVVRFNYGNEVKGKPRVTIIYPLNTLNNVRYFNDED